MRKEKDTLGEVAVPEGKYWGAQTERSRENFQIGCEKMPIQLIYALALVKKAAAIVNSDLAILAEEKRDLITKVCDEILSGKLDDHFPLLVWQTGSGTQTNMNLNEVISNRSIEIAGGVLGSKEPIHPNDDVNKSQSSNDVFPSAMHIAVAIEVEDRLIPNLTLFQEALEELQHRYQKLIKIGRTHLMDATPLTLGQEFSGYASQIKHAIQSLQANVKDLHLLALGGTAVGTGINAPKGYSEKIAKVLSNLTGKPLKTASNKFESLASSDALVTLSGSLKRVACAFMKIANDIRWMNSGPRCGIGEIHIPENEPGSSIMPGKVNPTQCEALMMLAMQVMGNDATISIAASMGNFELNVCRPVMIHSLLQSITLLSDGAKNFTTKCLKGLEANRSKITENLHNSLMLATALNQEIGYDQASKIVRKAHLEGLSLKESAMELKILSEERFDEIINEALHPDHWQIDTQEPVQ